MYYYTMVHGYIKGFCLWKIVLAKEYLNKQASVSNRVSYGKHKQQLQGKCMHICPIGIHTTSAYDHLMNWALVVALRTHPSAV